MRTAIWSLAALAGAALAAPSSDAWGDNGSQDSWGSGSSDSWGSSATSSTVSKASTVSSASKSSPVASSPVASSPVSSPSSVASTPSVVTKSSTPSAAISTSTSVAVSTPSKASSVPVVSKPSVSAPVSSAPVSSASKPKETHTRTTVVQSTVTVYTTVYTTVGTGSTTLTIGGKTTTSTFVTTDVHTATITSTVKVTPSPKASTEGSPVGPASAPTTSVVTGSSVYTSVGTSQSGTTHVKTTSTITDYFTTTVTLPKPTGTASSPDTTVTRVTTLYTTVCPVTSTWVSGDKTFTSVWETTSTGSAPWTTVTQVTSVFTTVCPATATTVSAGKTYTTTYDVTSRVTSTLETTVTLASSVLTWGTNTVPVTVPLPEVTSTKSFIGHSNSTKSHHGHHSKHSSKLSSLLASGSASVKHHVSGASSVSRLPLSTIASSTSKSVPTSTGRALGPNPYGENCVPCQGQPGSDPNEFCGYTVHDDSYKVTPITCVHRTYDFTLQNVTVSPDGFERYGLVINGQVPGPRVEANWGDWISITLHNTLDSNGTSLHMHGFRQFYTNEMDGVPSLTQCALAPGDSMTYTFRADNYGSSWYHSHFSLQTYEGFFGPVVIHGPDHVDYDFEESITLSDWNHIPVDQMFDAAQFVGPQPEYGPRTLDTGLINGVNVWGNGSSQTGENFVLDVQANKKYRLRIVSSSIQASWKFSVDGHSLTVIATDFVPITPYQTNILSVNIGQRYDVILETNQAPGNYWMRSTNQQSCNTITNGAVQGIVRYAGADVASPTTSAYPYTDECVDEPLASIVPVLPFTVGAATDTVQEDIFIAPFNPDHPDVYRWTLSNAYFQTEWGVSSLAGIYENGSVPYAGNLVIEAPKLGEWVYIIIDSRIPVPHPIHLHGHDFFILAQGYGMYDSSSTVLNLNNPARRDVALMPASGPGGGGHLVIAYLTDNPGVWLLHCHIGWHNAMGFALQIIEGLDDIKDTIAAPTQLTETCKNWHAYADEYDVVTIDSGV